MAHGDAREGKWRGNWRIEWVATTLHTTSEHGESSITTTDAQISAANSRLNWRPRRFKWTRSFRWKTKSGFCACAITFQTQSTTRHSVLAGTQPSLAAGVYKVFTNCGPTAQSYALQISYWGTHWAPRNKSQASDLAPRICTANLSAILLNCGGKSCGKSAKGTSHWSTCDI